MDLASFRPNLRPVYAFNGEFGCRTLWDGFQFPSRLSANTSTPLTGISIEGFTLPIVGYSDYYILPTLDSIEDPEGGEPKTVNLWCGGTMRLYETLLERSGAASARFRQLPASLEDMMGFLFDPDLAFTMIWAFPGFNFKHFTMSRQGPYVSQMEYGNICMVKMFHRDDFLFLSVFEPIAWIGIVISVLVMSLVTSIVSLTERSSSDSGSWWTKVVNPKSGFISVLTGYVGLLLAQSQGHLLVLNRMLIGLWLLIATILVGCMSGSMRDLMANADKVTYLESIDQLFTMQDFSRHTLFSLNMDPTWPDFVAKHGDEAEVMKQVKIREVIIFEFSTESVVDVYGALQRLMQILLIGFQNLIFLMFKIPLFLMLCICEVFREPIVDFLVDGLKFKDSKMAANGYLEHEFGLLENEATIIPATGFSATWIPIFRQAPHEVDLYTEDL